MRFPAKVLITVVIIFGIGLGTGLLTFGVLMSRNYRDENAGFISVGAAILVGSSAALFAHMFGGFRDLDSIQDRELDDPDL